MGDFKNDLGREKANELRVAHLLAGTIGASGVQQTSGRFSAYDYTMEKAGRVYSFEQKADYYAKPSHRHIFVETASANRGFPAGVSVMDADYLVYDLPGLNAVAVFRARPFTQHFFAHTGDYRHFPRAGDGSAGFVVPLSITGQVPCTVLYT